MSDDPLIAAVARAIDAAALRRELDRLGVQPSTVASKSPAKEPVGVAAQVLERIMLTDLLDESILNAAKGDTPFPLRLFLGELGAALSDETAFALASGLNFFFRADMDEEARMRTAIEVSRVYYKFAASRLDARALREVSPLIAGVLGTMLERLTLHAVDHDAAFDSKIHEREPGSNPTSGVIKRPASLLCRVAATGGVRVKASVVT